MSQEALKEKMIAFSETYEYSNLLTIDASGSPKGRMMENLPVGNDLVFWFATGIESTKVQEIKDNPSAGVFLYRPSDHSSVSISGKAEIVTDDATRKEKWKEKWSAYWKGPTDPAYALIKIVPSKAVLLDFPNHQQEVLEL